MPQSLANIDIHLIFSTKDRFPFLTDEIRPSLHSYFGQVGKTLDCPLILVNSVEEFKNPKSKWLKSQSPDLAKFAWQSGYGAFSVSESNLASVTAYIRNQREHHRTQSFQDEFRTFLTKNNLTFDERHLWD